MIRSTVSIIGKSARRVLLLTFFCAPSLLPLVHAAAKERPNIVLMMADDLGWGDVGFNGNKTILTPNLDEMAEQGMRFTRFYAASAVCSPTRGACITGRHPYRYGVLTANAGHMKPPEWTLAELLKGQGYVTGHFGKWHLGTLTKTVRESNRGGPNGVKDYAPPWENGFDVCFSTEAKTPTYDPMLQPKNRASRQGWDYIQDTANAVPYGTHYWNEDGEIISDNLRGDDSRVIMDRAIPFIEQAAADGKPFFAIVWFHAPHLPVVAGPEHARTYANYDSYTKNYYGCITALDQQVGRLRAALSNSGVAENTMLWFASDNGPEGQAGKAPGTAGPFRGRKRDLYEGGIRVPGLLEWPARVKANQTTEFPAVTSDYLPTILDALDIRFPDQRPIDGITLLPLIDGTMTKRPRPIGFEFAGKVALIDNRFKLIRHGNGRRANKKPAEGSPWMLFDLSEDPAEKTDIARENPQIVTRMAELVRNWRESCRRSRVGDDY